MATRSGAIAGRGVALNDTRAVTLWRGGADLDGLSDGEDDAVHEGEVASEASRKGSARMIWSILARDPATGTLMQLWQPDSSRSVHWRPMSKVAWRRWRPKALVNPMYPVHGMPRLRAGQSPGAVIEALLAADAGRARRQVHILDADGRVAAHTGAACVG